MQKVIHILHAHAGNLLFQLSISRGGNIARSMARAEPQQKQVGTEQHRKRQKKKTAVPHLAQLSGKQACHASSSPKMVR